MDGNKGFDGIENCCLSSALYDTSAGLVLLVLSTRIEDTDAECKLCKGVPVKAEFFMVKTISDTGVCIV